MSRGWRYCARSAATGSRRSRRSETRATAGGVDIPYIAYRDLIDEPLPPARMNGAGKRWAITLMAGSTLALERPPYVDAVFARDDPKPALVQLGRFAHRGIHRLKPAATASGGVHGS